MRLQVFIVSHEETGIVFCPRVAEHSYPYAIRGTNKSKWQRRKLHSYITTWLHGHGWKTTLVRSVKSLIHLGCHRYCIKYIATRPQAGFTEFKTTRLPRPALPYKVVLGSLRCVLIARYFCVPHKMKVSPGHYHQNSFRFRLKHWGTK